AKKTHFGISKRFTPLRDEGKPRPYNVSVFWFWAIEIPVRFGDPVVGLRRRNRLAVGYPPYGGGAFSATWGRGQASPIQR
ncbi:MAG: hypothetical protein LBQ66_05870, partial [Planctomycetaceae bacterium]|nr:hypothetical protein [Planctomycetaceae bacterium]